MARVALINPGGKKEFALTEPLSLLYLGAYLEDKGVSVQIIDEVAGDNIRKSLRDGKPEVIGITAFTSSAERAYDISDMCRSKGILTVLGGVHPTIFPEEALRHADIVVKGEGEEALHKIVQGDHTSRIIDGGYEENIDSLPFPARDLLKKEYYFYTKDRFGNTFSELLFVPRSTRLAAMITSRGCPYRCIFCHNSIRKSPVRFHSPERVLEEIKQLYHKYGVRAIFFMDDNLLLNKERLRKICEGIIREKIELTWVCATTSNHINEETVVLIKRAGCRQVIFGFESGSQRVLEILQKRTTVKKNSKAAKICKENDLLVSGNFMIGNPEESKEDIRLTQKFIQENQDYIDMLGVSICTPYPGTKLWEWCQESGRIPQNFRWLQLNQEDVPPIKVWDAGTVHELRSLRIETLNAKQLSLKRLWKKFKMSPLKCSYLVIRYPKTIFHVALAFLTKGNTIRG